MTDNKEKNELIIAEKILTVGERILASDLFKKTFDQTHHKISNVGDHTLNVTTTALSMAINHNRKGTVVNEDDVIIAGLCHDLGIIGRREKYRNDYECGQCHARDSVVCAKEILPDLSPRAEDAIKNHMWPVTKEKPHFREGFILISADKICASLEWGAYLFHTDIHGLAKSVIKAGIGRC